MEQILASRSVSITELKRSPSAVLEQAGSEPVAVLNHNRPAAYLLPPHVYEAMLERLKDVYKRQPLTSPTICSAVPRRRRLCADAS